MKWPFVLRSTHERLLQEARAGAKPAVPVPSLHSIGGMVQLHGHAAVRSAVLGKPVFQFAAFRAAPHQPGALVLVLAGDLSDDDMRRCRAFSCGMAQDAAPNVPQKSVVNDLGREESP